MRNRDGHPRATRVKLPRSLLAASALLISLGIVVPLRLAQAATTTAAITVNVGSIIKSYPAAPPFTAPYMPDYTAASSEFAPTAERHGADLDTIVTSQTAYQTAHPSDAPCGDARSDCGEGGNNGGVPEYNWTGEIDPEINLLTHANRAPSKYVFLILKTPSWLQSSPGNNISYPTNLTAWSNIAADMWHHLYLKAPAWVSKTYIEIWNEPDGKGISLSQYETLYAAAAKAIKTTAATFNSTALVGGYTGAQFNTSWLQGWLSNTSDNPYIDFVSWHEYANQHVSGSSVPQTMWNNIVGQYPSYMTNSFSTAKNYISTYDSALQQNGGTHSNTIPILITEYNEDAGGSAAVEGSSTYEIPYLGMFKQLAFNGGIDGINFFYPGGPDFGCQFVSQGMYLTDCSSVIAPWAWVEYLYERSVGLQYQPFSVVQTSSSDSAQFPVAFKFNDGSIGLVATNSSTANSVTYTVTVNNPGLSGTYTIHDYLVDPTHHVQQQPDIAGTASSTTSPITFTVTVPPSSVNGFTIAAGSGTAPHVPTYQFQPFSDDFTGYGAAGATVAPPGHDHYTPDFPTWISTGQNNPFTAVNGTVATQASDSLTFADSGAGTSTNAVKISGPGQTYVRTGSYMADWTRPPGNQKVAITFQTDWSNMNAGGQGAITSQLILDPDMGNPSGNPLGSSHYLLLQNANGTLSLKTASTTLGTFAFTPTTKSLTSWRIVIDATNVELDRYNAGTGTWNSVIGPVAHGLPQTGTGMEAGLLYLGLTGPTGAAGTNYWANVSIAALGTGTMPTPGPTSTAGPPGTAGPTSTATTTPLPTATSTPIPAPTTLFSDSFDGDALGTTPAGWSVASGTWQVQQGSGTNTSRVVTQTDAVTTTPMELVAGSPAWTDYTVQADVQAPASANSITVAARRQDVNNNYQFLLKNGNEWDLGKRVAGTWTSLGVGTFTYTAGTWYTLALSVQGTTISGSINGTTMVTATDSSFGSGGFSLRTTTTPSYDNVLVTTSSGGVPSPTSTATPVPSTPTNTPVVPTATTAPPTATPTKTLLPTTPTPTATPVPSTPTNTPVAPTSTATPVPSTPTNTPVASTTPTPAATAGSGGSNTIEDSFTQPNQTGWGSSTNWDALPNVAWGMDGNGSQSFVTISGNTGSYGYPGTTNLVGIASAGSTTYNGGNSLVALSVNAVGHVIPYIAQNACSDKSCYYAARLHTSAGLLELAKRSANTTTVLASVPFTANPTTLYWLRLNVSVGSGSDTLQAKVWANGSSEPSSWMVTATDASPLAANLNGTGGSWDQAGTGEAVSYTCYAYAKSGLAQPCAASPPTPTSTPTATPLPPPTTTPVPTPTMTPVPPTPTATPKKKHH